MPALGHALRVIDGDITAITAGVILHQTNCLGKTGGLAGALRRRFPRQFDVYDRFCEENCLNVEAMLGRARCGFHGGVAVVHCFGQVRFGRDRQHTDMVAVERALTEAASGIAASSRLRGLPVYAPWMMGCGRGGGAWPTYQQSLSRHFPGVIVVRNPAFDLSTPQGGGPRDERTMANCPGNPQN